MPRFEITGKGKETGRKRKRVYSAANESDARTLAERDDTLVDRVVELPPEPATDNQLAYTKDLGCPVPLNTTRDELSDLLSLNVTNDKPATDRYREFARLFGVETTKYTSASAIFSRIHNDLAAPGREKELISWFTFRVYRSLVDGVERAPIDSPNDPVIQEIAEHLALDEKVVRSARSKFVASAVTQNAAARSAAMVAQSILALVMAINLICSGKNGWLFRLFRGLRSTLRE